MIMIHRKFLMLAALFCFLGILSSCGGTESNQPTPTRARTTFPTPTKQENLQGEVQITATPEAPQVEMQIRPKDGMSMVHIPAGTFQMGSSNIEIKYALELCQEHYHTCNR
jgi:formylglycine-generating enzyme required for sulfatase activity